MPGVHLVTTSDFLDLLGAEPDEPEVPEYAPATAADIVSVAAELGWLSDGRYLSPAVPAGPVHTPDARAFGSLRSP